MGFLDFFRKKRELPANHEPPNFKLLSNKTHFKKKEVKVLYERYLSLCNYETGLLEKVPFVQQPELALNPVIDLAYDMECRNFFNLRVKLQHEIEKQKQRELEEAHERFLEERAYSAKQKSPSRQKKRKKRHNKKKKRKHEKDNIDTSLEPESSLESLEGSLESLEGSLESLDESLESVEIGHVHSETVSEDNKSNAGGGEKNTACPVVDNIMSSEEDARKNESSADIIDEESKEHIEDVEVTKLVEEDTDVIDAKPEETAFNKESNVDHDNQVQSQDTIEGFADENGEKTDQKENKSDNEGHSNPNNKIIPNSSDGISIEEGEGEGDVGRSKEIGDDNPNSQSSSEPSLKPMISSFFRAQDRLRKLEEEKRLAGIPPQGIDFTHFVLILNEFSPKASISSKTSCKFI